MKIRIALGLCAVLGASFFSIRAADTPAQATARAALEQKLNHPDNSPTWSLPATNTLPEAVVEQPGESAANVAEIVPEKAPAPETAPLATAPVAAPVAVAPAAIAPGVASPASGVPAAAHAMLLLVPAILFFSLLLTSLLIISLLLLKLRQMKLLLLKTPAAAAPPVVAPSKIQPAAAAATPKPTPAPAATKRPVQRRKRVRQLNGAESDVTLSKIEWATAKPERRRVTHS